MRLLVSLTVARPGFVFAPKISAEKAEANDAIDAAITARQDAAVEAFIKDPAGPSARIEQECEEEYAAELAAAAASASAATRAAEQQLA